MFGFRKTFSDMTIEIHIYMALVSGKLIAVLAMEWILKMEAKRTWNWGNAHVGDKRDLQNEPNHMIAIEWAMQWMKYRNLAMHYNHEITVIGDCAHGIWKREKEWQVEMCEFNGLSVIIKYVSD